MDLFNNHNLAFRRKEEREDLLDESFKAFIDQKLRYETDRFAGYSDEKILEILSEEFSMYKNAAPNKKGWIFPPPP